MDQLVKDFYRYTLGESPSRDYFLGFASKEGREAFVRGVADDKRRAFCRPVVERLIAKGII